MRKSQVCQTAIPKREQDEGHKIRQARPLGSVGSCISKKPVWEHLHGSPNYDATRETRLYFQNKKSQTISSYKLDEAFIETQTGNHIKVVRLDRGGEFQAELLKTHQDQNGTVRKFTVHNSPPQNGVAERGMRT